MSSIRAAMIVIKDSSLLLIRRIRNGSVFYVIPGGTAEVGESLMDAAKRELFEETTLLADVGKKVFETLDELSHCTYFLAENIRGTPTLAGEELARNCDKNNYEVIWVPISELPSLVLYPTDLLEKLRTFVL